MSSRIIRGSMWVLLAIMGIALLVFVQAAPFVRPFSDDYCYDYLARTLGVGGSVAYWYNNINSRYLAFVLYGFAYPIHYQVVNLITALMLVGWWIALVGVFSTMLTRLRGAYAIVVPRFSAVLLASMFLLTLFTGQIIPARAIFWATSSFMYCLPMALFTVYWWIALQSRQNNLWLLLGCALFAYLPTGFSDIQTGAQVLIFGTATALTFRRQTLRSPLFWRYLIGFVVSVMGLAILLAAPGNGERSGWIDQNLGKAVSQTLSSMTLPLIIGIQRITLGFVALAAVPFAAAYYAPFTSNAIRRKRSRLWIIGVLICTGILLAACFGPPAYLVGYSLQAYGWIIPLAYILVGLMIAGWQLGLSLKPNTPATLPQRWQIAGIALLLCFGLQAGYSAINLTTRMGVYAYAWDQRDKDIRARLAAGEGSPIVDPFVNPYDRSIPVTANEGPLVTQILDSISPYRDDIIEDTAWFANKCMARYYGTAAILGQK